MKASAQLRAKTGISVRQLARFIGVSHSLLHMAENNTRPMNSDSAVILAQMITLEVQCPAPPPAQNIPTAEDIATWQWRARECRFEIQKLQQKLAAMQTGYEQALRLSAFVAHLEANASWPFTPRMQRTMEDWKHQARNNMAGFHPVKQKHLELQIAALTAEAEIYERETGNPV